MSLRLNDNRKPLFLFENDRFAEVDSFSLLAGDLERAWAVIKNNMRQQVAKYQKNQNSKKVKIHEICFLKQEKVILEHINRFQMKGDIESNCHFKNEFISNNATRVKKTS